jgi:hypothetical protein
MQTPRSNYIHQGIQRKQVNCANNFPLRVIPSSFDVTAPPTIRNKRFIMYQMAARTETCASVSSLTRLAERAGARAGGFQPGEALRRTGYELDVHLSMPFGRICLPIRD